MTMFGTKAIGLLALATAMFTTTDGTLLRRELKAGATDEYEIRCTQTTTPGEGLPGDPHSVKVSWKAAYGIESLNDKGAVLKVDVTDFTFTAEGANASPDIPKTRTVKGTIDSRNRIDAAEPAPRPGTTTQLWLVTDAVEFPEKEVNVGDTWETTLPASIPLGEKKTTLTAKLSGEESYEGKSAWVVTMEKKNVPTENRVKLRIGPTGETKEAKFVGKADVSIKALIEKGTGRTLTITTKVHANQELIVPDAPAPTTSVIDYVGTMKLKPAKA
jgi:hypothetical protein